MVLIIPLNESRRSVLLLPLLCQTDGKVKAAEVK